MRVCAVTFAIAALLCSLSSCARQEVEQRDLLLEVAKSFEEIADRELAEGRLVYGKYCSGCHGVDGRGDGFNAYNLDPKPRDFADSSFRPHLDSILIMETISAGGAATGLSPLMPAWGRTLSDTDIRNVYYYLTYLARIGAE